MKSEVNGIILNVTIINLIMRKVFVEMSVDRGLLPPSEHWEIVIQISVLHDAVVPMFE